MSQETEYIDPRESVSFDIEPGMVFTDDRADDEREVVIDYAERDGGVIFIDTEGDVNRDVVYLYDDYDSFEGEVGAGRYTPVRTESGKIERRNRFGQIHDLLDRYESSDGRTESHKAEAIQEVLDILIDDVPDDHNETIPLEDIDGIGNAGAQSLRDNNITTKGDVRSTSTEELQSLPYMGEKNTANLEAYVEQ